MANSIAYRKNYTDILDRVYQRTACSTVLNSPARMARAGRSAQEIMTPKISVTGLGDYTRNVGYKTGSITFDYETKAFNSDSKNVGSRFCGRRRPLLSCSRDRIAAS